LNTVLRGTKPDSIFCSRTCRIASIEEEGLELPKGLALMNARDLKVMIEVTPLLRICAMALADARQWNEQNKWGLIFYSEWSPADSSRIRFMRMSSEMFPFASHAKYGYDLSFAATELKEAGDLAKKYGHRLTMHPGQVSRRRLPTMGREN
jgi:UV DNA damage endonuclease